MEMKEEISVLIIEDNLNDYLLLKEILDFSTELNATIHHSDRLYDAITIAMDNPIDVAVLDLDLPDSFGLDTFYSFHRDHPSIPAIIYSGRRDHELAFQGVKNGAQDYLFKGEPSETAIIRTIRYAIERQRLLTDLKEALKHVKQLQGMLPICSFCKNIRDDEGYWRELEYYISKHSEARFSHGLCPPCARKHYPDVFKKK